MTPLLPSSTPLAHGRFKTRASWMTGAWGAPLDDMDRNFCKFSGKSRENKLKTHKWCHSSSRELTTSFRSGAEVPMRKRKNILSDRKNFVGASLVFSTGSEQSWNAKDFIKKCYGKRLKTQEVVMTFVKVVANSAMKFEVFNGFYENSVYLLWSFLL